MPRHSSCSWRGRHARATAPRWAVDGQAAEVSRRVEGPPPSVRAAAAAMVAAEGRARAAAETAGGVTGVAMGGEREARESEEWEEEVQVEAGDRVPSRARR